MKLLSQCLLICASLTLLNACSSNPSDQEQSIQENKDFYPLNAYIKQELKELDSLPVAVFLYRESSQGMDTQLVEKTAFRAMAEKLSVPDITVDPLKKSYRESVYMDNTLNLVTLSYSTKDPSLEIQKIDVYVNPESDKVKNIYIEKRSAAGDSVVSSKVVWTTGKQVQITRMVLRESGQEEVIREKYSWGMPQ